MWNGFIFKKLCRVSSFVNLETIRQIRDTTLKKFFNECNEGDVFNADKTSIFYKFLLEKSLVFNDEICSGANQAKKRLTVLLATNMSGTKNHPLYTTANIVKPHCFKVIKMLLVIYKANKKAWITLENFKEWVKMLDKKKK